MPVWLKQYYTDVHYISGLRREFRDGWLAVKEEELRHRVIVGSCLVTVVLLLFPHYLIATMRSVVTGQAPITLERAITSGGKQIKNRR